MKNLFIMTLVFFALLACATDPAPIRADTTIIVKTVQTGLPAADAFDVSLKWINERFTEGNSILKGSDSKAGIITETASLVFPGQNYYMDFTLSIHIVGGSSQLTFTAMDAMTIQNGKSYQGFVSLSDMQSFSKRVETLTSDYAEYLKMKGSQG